ncbi:LysE family translocator [Paracoccus sp. TK19116]|uniref:LysE family translocator n=1 Tax=Paracoccus albicereus TaxID=2922394 RepID=A0ABT1MNT1_9RHOB|nr:LysE family translocator [Paracoccus albicereus]MCQ0969945.1 LysE family translocator [Paracoccus albicereus]
MDQNLLFALVGFAFVSTATPGPNNMMLLASGVNFGVTRTVPHLLGISLGLGAMVVAVGLGVTTLFARWPLLEELLKWLSLGYMIWLAAKIARSGRPEAKAAGAKPMTFLQAAAFQWVNPKAWAMALGALSAYAAGVGGSAVVALTFIVVGLPVIFLWAAMGQGLRGYLADERRLRIFNWTMAALLVLSMLPVVFH